MKLVNPALAICARVTRVLGVRFLRFSPDTLIYIHVVMPEQNLRYRILILVIPGELA